MNSTLDQIDDDTGDGVCHTAAGTCTLRAAVMQANTISGAGATIVLPAGLYLLTRPVAGANGPDNGDLNLTTPADSAFIAIVGAGAATTIIDAQQIDRVLEVEAYRHASLSGLTLRNGKGAYNGGGIRNEGTLSLEGVVVTACSGRDGGGIASSGPLSVSRSRIEGNSAITPPMEYGGDGGGIFTNGGLVLVDSTVSGNFADVSGGGVLAYGAAEVLRSTIAGNAADLGGGFRVFASLFVTNSTISSNDSRSDGGGIWTFSGNINVYNSTIVANQADSDVDFDGTGAGVFVGTNATFNIRNSVFAANYLSQSPVYDDCRGEIGAYGVNAFWNVAPQCAITQPDGGSTFLISSLTEIGPLQSNGGLTQTHALVAASAMIDGADPFNGCRDKSFNLIPIDQRGGPRVVGARCDLGAFEVGALPAGTIFSDGFETGDLWSWN
ncbi:MAG: choice-of-anchor Q domain-containing protein [Thermoanaerobaculia bacterium]